MSETYLDPELKPKKDKFMRQTIAHCPNKSSEYVFWQNTEKAGNSNRNSIKLGVCAMEKKIYCKPMQEILKRLSSTGEMTIITFSETMILSIPIQDWPIVDCLITFHSTGFPLAKAEAYVELRKPYLINELKFQDSLLWRHKVYDILIQHGIPVPKHYVVIEDKTRSKSVKSPFTRETSVNHHESQVDENSSLPGSSLEFLKSNEESTKLTHSNSIKEDLLNSSHNGLCDLEDVLTNAEEDEDYLTIKSSRQSTLMNRKHMHSSLSKSNTRGIDLYVDYIKMKSEHLSLPNSVRNERKEEEEDEFSLIEEPSRAPLSNYFRKYHTKVEENDDFIVIGGHKLLKPFVQKPLDAEDHKINIYYPKGDGGGCKNLFRKTNNISSSFDPHKNELRKGGSFIYEQFLPTEGFDIKVYTVGPNYAHAEARKSPVLDGVVQRTKEGKEVRFPINLTYEEKIIAKKIVFAFDQQICGFDLLRSKGKSYVCDVNGWSFVKGNQKYYADCATLLRGMILARFAPERLTPLHSLLSQLNTIRYDYDFGNPFRPNTEERSSNKEELRSVVAIFRHGDRTPKQKMKMITNDQRYLSLFDEQTDKKKEIKLKSIKQLQQILNYTQEVIKDFCNSKMSTHNEFTSEIMTKHLQLFSVLKKGGHFEGINRKIQLKPLEWQQISDPQTGEIREVVTQGLFILKWGGELTHTGIEQAQELGEIFRNQVYPQENEGLLRLHATCRHDLKIYSSQEGRCQKTAAAFCKGLLELEGDLTPILVSMVRKDEVTQELLEFNKVQESLQIHDLKDRLSVLMNSNDLLYDSVAKIADEKTIDDNMRKVLQDIGRPLPVLYRIYDLIKLLGWNIKKALATDENSYYLSLNDFGFDLPDFHKFFPGKRVDPKIDENTCEEVTILVYKRWKKLESDFYKVKEGLFDISKVPDIYYSICYDILHTKRLVEANREICIELYECSQKLALFVISAEYGLTGEEVVDSSVHIASNLLKKIKNDLVWWNSPYLSQTEQIIKDEQSFLEHKGLDLSKVGEEVKSLWRHVRTRLYFTSASHLHSLYNVISMGLLKFYPQSEDVKSLPRLTSLDYLSHIMIRLYENLNADHEDPNRFRLEIMLSQGCNMRETKVWETGEHRVPISPSIVLNSQMTLSEIEQFSNGLLKLGSRN